MTITRRRPQKIPEPIAVLQQQLEQWRSENPPRTKLPASFWQSAVELAKQYGVYQTAHPLRLDYMGLKKRVLGPAGARQQAAQPGFVELIVPRPAMPDECLIEFESSQGAKMRIQWKASAAPDWASLLRAWRDVER